jgi:hypothetical protein
MGHKFDADESKGKNTAAFEDIGSNTAQPEHEGNNKAESVCQEKMSFLQKLIWMTP